MVAIILWFLVVICQYFYFIDLDEDDDDDDDEDDDEDEDEVNIDEEDEDDVSVEGEGGEVGLDYLMKSNLEVCYEYLFVSWLKIIL